MENKFTMQNEVEEKMEVIQEEISDEDTSSKEENDSDKKVKTPCRVTNLPKRFKNNEASYETGEISDIKSKDNSTRLVGSLTRQRSGKNLLKEKFFKHNSDFNEEEKVQNPELFNSFQDNFDNHMHRGHRSSSCKSATNSLKFSNHRLLKKSITKSPFLPYGKHSHQFSLSNSKNKTRVPSLFGIYNRKMSEPSLVDLNRQMESNSKCLSEVSLNLSRRGSETLKSVPVNR